MTVNYTINGKDLWTQFGIKVEASRGLIDAPKFVEPIAGEWPDHHGRIVDLTKRIYDQNEIVLDCWLLGTSAADYQAKMSLFLKEWASAGLQQLRVSVSTVTAGPLVFQVYLQDAINPVKQWRDGQMIGTFQLKLIEPEPVKRVLSAAVSAGGAVSLVFTSVNPINIHWGDGSVTRDVNGTAQTSGHTYTAAGTYYIVMTGRIEDVTAFTPTGATQIWERLP